MNMNYDRSAPSIPEMQDMLTRPEGVDFYRFKDSPKVVRCEKCGTRKSAWWYVQNGKRFCADCA